MKKRFLIVGLSVFSMVFAGCWSSTEVRPISPEEVRNSKPDASLSMIKSFVVKSAGRTAVFCLNGTDQEKDARETQIVGQMKALGFDAVKGRDQIPAATEYSSMDLAKALREAGFSSIAEVVLTPSNPPAQPVERVHFKLHSLPDPAKTRYSRLQQPLNMALTMLIEAAVYQVAR